MKYFTRI